MVTRCLGVNENGHLTIGGADAVSLAEHFGTPLYVFDEQTIRGHCRKFKESLEEFYGGRGGVAYAGKAFCCLEMYRILKEEGMMADVTSVGEIYTAIKAGFPPKKIFFHGNNKTRAEIVYALENGVGRFVADNIEEIQRINKVAGEHGVKANVLLRIKPGVDAHTHDFIKTGQIDSKFGFGLETGEAIAAAKITAESENLNLVGIHCHIGSQIFETEPFCLAAQIMIGFVAQVKKELGVELSELNLGGGFGIRYKETDTPKDYKTFMREVSGVLHSACEELGVQLPKVYLEPGRSIVAPAGHTLYTVGSVKEIPNIRNYVSVDGGLGDNPRYALYQAPYEVLVANKADQPRDYVATIAGRYCESGDLIQEHANIQKPVAGDIMAVLCTGAYNYSMASNYNRVPRPAAVMVKDGQARIIIDRESYEDIIKNDR